MLDYFNKNKNHGAKGQKRQFRTQDKRDEYENKANDDTGFFKEICVAF